MWTQIPRPRHACLAAALPAGLLLSLPAAAQAADAVGRMPSVDSFDTSDWVSLLVIVLCGAIGAFASDLVSDGGRLDRFRREDTGWSLGFIGKLVVGAVAAAVMLALNPSDEWWQLIGTALAAGVGGEAILLSIIAAKKAEGAEKDRKKAEERARDIASLARKRLATLSSMAAAGPAGVSAVEAASLEPPPSRGTVAMLASRFADEIAEFAALEAPLSVRDRVLEILKRVLRRSDVEKDPIGKLGADREEILDMIVHELAQAFPSSQPPFDHGDVSGDDTLADITSRVRSRQP